MNLAESNSVAASLHSTNVARVIVRESVWFVLGWDIKLFAPDKHAARRLVNLMQTYLHLLTHSHSLPAESSDNRRRSTGSRVSTAARKGH